MKLLKQTFSIDASCLIDISSTTFEDLNPLVVDHLVEKDRLPASERDKVIQRLVERKNVVLNGNRSGDA